MLHKTLSIVLMLAAVAAGAAVLVLKLEVQESRDRVDQLVDQIKADRSAIRVLEAEHVYLSSPRRLQDGVIAHMPLMPVTAEQIITSPTQIPLRRDKRPVEADARLLRALPPAKAKTDQQEVGT